MPAYDFKPDFAPAIERGEKVLTLRDERTAPARHAHPTELVALWTGLRTKAARRLGLGICIARATVVISPAGVERLEGLVIASPHDAMSRRLTEWAAQSAALCHLWADDFARLDGFDTWAQAFAWHVTGAAPAARLRKDLVAWRLVPRDTEGQALRALSLEAAA